MLLVLGTNTIEIVVEEKTADKTIEILPSSPKKTPSSSESPIAEYEDISSSILEHIHDEQQQRYKLKEKRLSVEIGKKQAISQ